MNNLKFGKKQLVTRDVYKMVGTGLDKKFPRINLPRELAGGIGKYYSVYREEDGTIILKPMTL